MRVSSARNIVVVDIFDKVDNKNITV